MRNLSPIGWAVRPLRNYGNFSGRASRAEFWWFVLFTMIIYFVLSFVFAATATGLAAIYSSGALLDGALGPLMIFVGLFWLAVFIPLLAVQFRRLHDINRSGWWLGGFWFLYLVYMALLFAMMSETQTPGQLSERSILRGTIAVALFIYSIVLLIFFCLPGTRGTNRFGEDPYGEDVSDVFA